MPELDEQDNQQPNPQTAPEPIEEKAPEGYKSPQQLVFRQEFEKVLKSYPKHYPSFNSYLNLCWICNW